MTELKTLKDLIKMRSGKAIIENTEKWGTIPMIEWNDGCLDSERIFSMVDHIELKQAAIKWIKHCEKERDNKSEQDLYDYWNGRMAALEDFFNITEEELK